jgi:hypothetical protein
MLGSPQKSKGNTKMGSYEIFAKGDLLRFHTWASQKFGGLVGLWRILDVNHNMRVSQDQFLVGLRDLGYAGDPKGLFKDLNRDQTGTLLFYHFAPEAALAVSQFLHWARVNHGSLADLAIASVVDKRSFITKEQFIQHCSKAGFANNFALDLAFELIDKDGDHSVNGPELALLDKWEFPEWLTAKPNAKAAETCTQKLIHHFHGNALSAWRYLNRTGSMRLPWNDFRHACRKLLSEEDCSTLPSAWRALDDDLSGWLSLREFDRTTYDELTHFVSWIVETYGSFSSAFPKLQAGNTEIQISQTEFRKVFKPSGLGDTVLSKIYIGLDVDRTDSISHQEIRFLNCWKVEMEQKEEEAWAALTKPDCLAPFAGLSKGLRGRKSGSNNRGSVCLAGGMGGIAERDTIAEAAPDDKERQRFRTG